MGPARWAVALLALALGAAAHADTLVLEATERGHIHWTGLFAVPLVHPWGDYSAGRGPQGIARSVFVFDLTSFEGGARGATLRIWSPPTGYRSPDRYERFDVYAVSCDPTELSGAFDLRSCWVDLGSGFAVAGGRVEPGVDGYVEVALDPAILRVLDRTRGSVALGLAVASLRNVALWRSWEERIFVGTHHPDVPPPQLVLETTPAAALEEATTLHVDAASRSRRPDGSPGAPFASIAAALDIATPGDDVAVAPGTYPEGVIMKRDVDLLGAGADRTIIDISGGQPSVRCADATLDGFLILQEPRGGWRPKPNAPPPPFQQAVDCTNQASPVLSNLGIVTPGNGIVMEFSHAIIRNCWIRAGIGGGYGSLGINAYGSAPTISDSFLEALIAFIRDDPFDSASDPVRIERSELRGRIELYGFSDGELRFTDNVVLPSSADPRFRHQYTGLYLGYSADAGLIAGNSFFGTRGIEIAWDAPSPAASRATIANNLLAFGSAGISVQRFYAPPQTLLHNAVFLNQDEALLPTDYRGIADATGTNGNIALDGLPEWQLDGFLPSADSPLVDGGTNEFVEAGALDFGGGERLADGDGDGQAVVDIGAEERQPGSLVVSIDLLPGKQDRPKARPPRKGSFAIAIQSQPGFDPSEDVDAATLAVRGWPVRQDRSGNPACRTRPEDREGPAALVCSFPNDALGGLAGLLLDQRVCVTGETRGGAPFVGCDPFELVR